MRLHVGHYNLFGLERFSAGVTGEFSVFAVDRLMFTFFVFAGKFFAASFANVRFVVCVRSLVSFQRGRLGEALRAFGATVRFFSRVGSFVSFQRIASEKFFMAFFAFVASVANFWFGDYF